VLVRALIDLDPHYPTVSDDVKRELDEARAELEG
jgi:hypothetical protein